MLQYNIKGSSRPIFFLAPRYNPSSPWVIRYHTQLYHSSITSFTGNRLAHNHSFKPVPKNLKSHLETKSRNRSRSRNPQNKPASHSKSFPSVYHTALSHNLESSPQIDPDLISSLIIPRVTPSEKVAFLDDIRNATTIYNSVRSTPERVKNLNVIGHAEKNIKKDLYKLGQITALVEANKNYGVGKRLQNSVSKSPTLRLSFEGDAEVVFEELIQAEKQYPDISSELLSRIVSHFPSLASAETEIFNILYELHRRNVRITTYPMMSPLIKAIQSLLNDIVNLSHTGINSLNESQNTLNHSTYQEFLTIINNAMDTVICSLEEIATDFKYRKVSEEYTTSIVEEELQDLVLSVQRLVLYYGSSLMRSRLIDCCRSLNFSKIYLSKLYSNEVLICLGHGPIYTTASDNASGFSILETLSTGLIPGSSSMNGIINDELEHALNVMMEASANDIEIQSFCNEIMIHKLLEINEVDLATQILKTMSEMKDNQTIFSRLWGHFVSVASDKMNLPALEWAWKEAIVPGKVIPSDATYYNIVQSCLLYLNSGEQLTEEQESTISEMLLDSIKSLGARSRYVEDPFLIASAVEEFASRRDFKTALRILTLSGPNASHIKLTDLPNLLSIIGKDKENMTHGIQVCYTALRHPNTSPAAVTLLFNAVCMGILKSGKRQVSMVNLLMKHIPGSGGGIQLSNENASNTVHQSRQPGEYTTGGLFHLSPHRIIPNTDTLQVLIEAAILARDSTILQQYYYQLVPYHIPFSRYALAYTAQGLLRLGENQRAIEFLNEELITHLGRHWESEENFQVTYLFRILKQSIEENAEIVKQKNIERFIN